MGCLVLLAYLLKYWSQCSQHYALRDMSPAATLMMLMDDNLMLCRKNVQDTKELLARLGFYIHEIKSVQIPTQILTHLGYSFNSVNMTLSLTRGKVEQLTKGVLTLLAQDTCSIRQVAELVGMMVANTVVAEFGQLHYRTLETEKVRLWGFATVILTPQLAYQRSVDRTWNGGFRMLSLALEAWTMGRPLWYSPPMLLLKDGVVWEHKTGFLWVLGGDGQNRSRNDT